MKKILSFAAVLSLLLTGLVSCSIEASRPFSGTLNVVVTNLPIPTGDAEEDFTALALYCNLNEWNVDNVNGSDIYITDVGSDGTATFVLNDYNFAETFSCQFVLMADKSVKLSSGTWWQTALSGGTYAESEDNMNYSFATAADGMTLTVKASGYTGKDRVHLGLSPFDVSGL